MTPLPYLGAVAVLGGDARAFLHAQLSADIARLPPGDSLTACYCDPKGRVLDHLAVHAGGDDRFTLLLHAGRVTSFLGRLRLFVLRSDVRLEALTAHTAFAVSDEGDPAASLPVFEGPGALRYTVDEGGAADVDSDTEAGRASVARQRFEELEHGMLWLDEALSGRYLPQMLGFDTIGSVNFRKGCYPGQEVVARARYLGKVKRLPALAVAEGVVDLPVGETVDLLPASGEEQAQGEIAAVAAAGGRTALFLVVRDRDLLTPATLRAAERTVPLQRWATM